MLPNLSDKAKFNVVFVVPIKPKKKIHQNSGEVRLALSFNKAKFYIVFMMPVKAKRCNSLCGSCILLGSSFCATATAPTATCVMTRGKIGTAVNKPNKHVKKLSGLGNRLCTTSAQVQSTLIKIIIRQTQNVDCCCLSLCHN